MKSTNLPDGNVGEVCWFVENCAKTDHERGQARQRLLGEKTLESDFAKGVIRLSLQISLLWAVIASDGMAKNCGFCG